VPEIKLKQREKTKKKGEEMIKILVVEDEAEICEFLGNFFKKRGHAVFAVTNPLEALPIVEKEKPQIILLDIIMPNMSGLELLEKIRAKDKDAKIIMVSVADEPPNIEEARRLGADDFIKKPFDIDYLEEVVMAKIQDFVK